MDIYVPEFASEGGQIGEVSYATRKVGYAFPVKLFREWFGENGFEYYNLIWWAVLLLIPIPGRRGSWLGWLLKIGAISSLPYTVKYTTMLNPTLQSMTLWLLLATLMIWRHRFRDRQGILSWAMSVCTGCVGGALVLTDFKWLPFVIVGVFMSIAWYAYTDHNAVGHSSFWTVRSIQSIAINTLTVVVWIPIVMGLVALVHRPYGDMVYAMLFTLPDRMGIVRWGICDNILLHLWYLGGFTFVLGTLLLGVSHRRSGSTELREWGPYWLMAALITGVFTVAVWPRGARMYVPALVLMIQFGAAAAAVVVSRPPDRRSHIIAWLGVGLMLMSLLAGAPRIRAALDTPSGLDELKANILDHIPKWGGTDGSDLHLRYDPPVLAACFVPVMIARASGDREVSWFSPKDGLMRKVNWAVTNPALDYFTILEQATSREAPPGWMSGPLVMLESIQQRGIITDSFPAPFYTTPYYLCESTFEGGQLSETIMAHERSIWQVRYIGALQGRPFNDTMGQGTE